MRKVKMPRLLLVLPLLLAACALPEPAPAPQRYDFGPPPVLAPANATAQRPLLALQVQASPALDGTALLYRLAYADDRQLRAYRQARWSMSPAELLQQRLRAGLARDFLLAPVGEGAPRLLYLELEEFSQVYSSAERSTGLLRLRASLLQRTSAGQQLQAQREWQWQEAAPSADAGGGVRALGASTDAAVTELVRWLQSLP